MTTPDAAAAPLKLNIRTRETGEPAGGDTSIISVPDDWYAVVGGNRALLARQVGRFLRELSERQAADLGERLHHAEWTITSDPALVRKLGMGHDCPSCRASMDQTLAHLRDNPGAEVAVGQLWWAAQ